MEPSSKLLSGNSLGLLKERKNLLAFSAGVDSTALFFLLLNEDIEFDIAIVDYGIREESKDEVAYAKELANRYDKKCYAKEIELDKSNFEAKAREARYSFFEEIIAKQGYNTLITAHQLNDRFEWFLMQLSKGAGVVELMGFDEIEKREGYLLVRPLLFSTKDELLGYLDGSEIRYFIDSSNSDPKYRRNYIRNSFSTPFLEEFSEGVKRSLEYLKSDAKNLFEPKLIKRVEELKIYKRGKDKIEDMRIIDYGLKSLGYIASSAQKSELLRQKGGVAGGKFVVVLMDDKIFLSPYSKATMSKEFKDRCRELRLPKLIRPYLYLMDIKPSSFIS